MTQLVVPVTDSYSLAVGDAAAQRLQLLQKIYGPSTKQVLTQVGLKPGMHVLDVGCGIGTITTWLADQVTTTGSVLGLDVSTEQIALARQLVGDQSNVRFQTVSAYETGLEPSQFDLVFCRFLLCHLTHPLDALREMSRLLKPGGVMVCEEVDLGVVFSSPDTPAYRESVEVALALGQQLRTHYRLGRSLHQLFGEAGLTNLQASLVQPVALRGEEKQYWLHSVRESSPAFVRAGIRTEAEMEQLCREMERINDDETVLVAHHAKMQVWGYKDGKS